MQNNDTHWSVFIFSTVGAACAYTSFLYYKELRLLNRIQKEISVGQEPQSVTEARNPRNVGKYCLISGILLSNEENAGEDEIMQGIKNVNHISPMAEVVLKNQFNLSNLSFNKNFTHIENRYNQAKFKLVDSRILQKGFS